MECQYVPFAMDDILGCAQAISRSPLKSHTFQAPKQRIPSMSDKIRIRGDTAAHMRQNPARKIFYTPGSCVSPHERIMISFARS